MIILGAGGHANEILDVLSKSFSSEELFLFDDTGAETKIYNHRFSRLLRSVLQLEEVLRHNPAFCVAVGNPKIRHKLTELALRYGGRPDNAIAQTAYVSPVAEVGTGLNIMHMSYISPGAIIEDGVLINTGALIHHDVIVSQYAEISPGATLLGGVVGIWMAFQGYGVYALVVQSLTAGVISTIPLGRMFSFQEFWQTS
jgi:UDP-3-O-[3-hydroxymyristoyl] glucosamine N-acyltransferase